MGGSKVNPADVSYLVDKRVPTLLENALSHLLNGPTNERSPDAFVGLCDFFKSEVPLGYRVHYNVMHAMDEMSKLERPVLKEAYGGGVGERREEVAKNLKPVFMQFGRHVAEKGQEMLADVTGPSHLSELGISYHKCQSTESEHQASAECTAIRHLATHPILTDLPEGERLKTEGREMLCFKVMAAVRHFGRTILATAQMPTATAPENHDDKPLMDALQKNWNTQFGRSRDLEFEFLPAADGHTYVMSLAEVLAIPGGIERSLGKITSGCHLRPELLPLLPEPFVNPATNNTEFQKRYLGFRDRDAMHACALKIHYACCEPMSLAYQSLLQPGRRALGEIIHSSGLNLRSLGLLWRWFRPGDLSDIEGWGPSLDSARAKGDEAALRLLAVEMAARAFKLMFRNTCKRSTSEPEGEAQTLMKRLREDEWLNRVLAPAVSERYGLPKEEGSEIVTLARRMPNDMLLQTCCNHVGARPQVSGADISSMDCEFKFLPMVKLCIPPIVGRGLSPNGLCYYDTNNAIIHW